MVFKICSKMHKNLATNYPTMRKNNNIKVLYKISWVLTKARLLFEMNSNNKIILIF